jgi:hypothetical protein
MHEAPGRSSDPVGGTAARISGRAGTRKSGTGAGAGCYAAANTSDSYARYDGAELAANSAADQMIVPKLNHWVQATPGCASCFFLSQWPGAPDPERWARLRHHYEQTYPQ